MPAAPDLPAIQAALAGHRPRKAPELGRAAAVLVPILPRPGGLHLLFTERSAHLKSHAGQVSFPGGSIDPEDRDATGAALREAEEEVGLDAGWARIIGTLDDCPTFVSGYVITPVVAVVEPPGPDPRWRHSPGEVVAVHELPLAGFCDPANLRVEEHQSQGYRYELFWYTVAGVTVWGATARILHQLIDLASGRGPGPDPGDWRRPEGVR